MKYNELEFGLAFKTKKLVLMAEVDEDMFYNLVTYTLMVEANKSKGKTDIYITSDGGACSVARAIADFINLNKKFYHRVIATGDVMSAGATILFSTNLPKYMTENAMLSLHQSAVELDKESRRTADYMSWGEQLKKENDLVKKLIAGRMIDNPAEYRKMMTAFDSCFDLTYTAEEALKLHLIDGILK